MWHDAADLHIPVAEPKIAEFGGGPKKHLLRKTAKGQHRRGKHAARLGNIVHCGDGSVAIDDQAGKAQSAGNPLPIDGEAGRCDGTGTHGRLVDPGVAVPQTFCITLQHFKVREEKMPKRCRLRWLVVRVRRHHGRPVLLRKPHQDIPQPKTGRNDA